MKESDDMSDLQFDIQLNWQGTGNEGEGQIRMGGGSFVCAAPASMGGKGVGVSPEDLLISAVASCYSGTFFSILSNRGLLVQQVHVRAEGLITGYPSQAKFSRIIVYPTVLGGDEEKQSEYEQCARTARKLCFIGKSIEGTMDYEVGDVQVTSSWMELDQINELIERFYIRLIQDEYFSNMFQERKVDIDLLRARQRIFIAKLARTMPESAVQDHLKQVQERHHFGMNAERAAEWLRYMEETMLEIGLMPGVRLPLLAKMKLFINHTAG
jgi:peroxiredoxin-like protein